MNTGKTIKEIRKGKNLTLGQAEKLLGINFGNMSLLENGKRDISQKMLEKVAKGYGLSPIYILLKSIEKSDFELTNEQIEIAWPQFQKMIEVFFNRKT